MHPLLTEAGERSGFVVVERDLTTRRREGRELERQRELLSNVLSTIPYSVFWKDRNSIYLGCNANFARDAGLKSPADIAGKCDFDLPWTRAEAEFYRACDQKVMNTLVPLVNIEETLKNADDRQTTILTSKVPLCDQDGEVIGMLGVYTDITDRKEFEKRLEQALKDLELKNIELSKARDQALASTRAKGLFLANVSHEIRTPMNGVIGMTELLLDTSLDAEQREYVNNISSCASSLLTVINDVLDLSKIEAGQMSVEITDFRVDLVLNEMFALYLPRAQGKGLQLRLEIDPGVPKLIRGDSVRLRQILTNFLGNAIKFTEQGGVTLHVTAGSRPGWIRLVVEDSGIGIAPDQHALIFETFTQVDGTSTRRFGGTGLGLSISRRLAALMGGFIGVESSVGNGSKFWIELPEGSGVVVTSERRGTSTPAPFLDGSRVLVVEDNPVNQMLTRRMIERLGGAVLLAGDGEEAVQRAAEHEVDIILMNVQMPKLDGFAATRQIRLDEERLGLARRPIIAITAHAMEGDRETCLEAGMDFYLTKPLQRRALNDVLMRLAPRVPEGGSTTLTEIFAESEALERVDGDWGVFFELLDLFRESYPGHLDVIRNSEAIPQVKASAHTLKGMLANLGAISASHRAAAIDREAGTLDAASRLELLNELSAEIRRFENPCAAAMRARRA